MDILHSYIYYIINIGDIVIFAEKGIKRLINKEIKNIGEI